jgi:DNA gyrase inhibitor GyrI
MPTYSVQRSRTIKATSEAAFALLRDFRRWPSWSPWLAVEPEARLDFATDGSRYAWDGRVIGAGSITRTGETRPERIDYELAFVRPFKSRSTTGFRLAPGGADGTEVTWAVEGSLPFFLFWMKPMLTAMIGMDFERGLRRLAAVLEEGAVPATLEFPGVVEAPAVRYLGLSANCATADIGPAMEQAFTRLGAWFHETGTTPAGPWFSIYRKWDVVRGQASFTACVPVSDAPTSLPDGLTLGERPALHTYAVQLTGPFDYLADAWAAGFGRAQAKVFKQAKSHPPFEVYEKSPETHPGEPPVTVVHFPAG